MERLHLAPSRNELEAVRSGPERRRPGGSVVAWQKLKRAGETTNAIYFFRIPFCRPSRALSHCLLPGVRFAHPRLFSAAPPGLVILIHKRLAPEARQIIAPGEFTSPGLMFEVHEP